MDALSLTILLLIAFVALNQKITWLFFGAIILFILVCRSISVILILIAALAAMYIFKLQEHWFVVLALVVGAVILVQSRKGGAPEGGEMYSPELMRLLGGGGA